MPTLSLARNSQFPTRFTDKVIKDSGLSVKARLLAHVLARHADADGLAHVTAPDLCQLCGFHRETLIEARRELEHRGYVSTDRRSQKIVAYRLSIEREGA